MDFNPLGLDYTNGYVLAKGTDGEFALQALSSVPARVDGAGVNTILRALVLHRGTSGVASSGIGAQLAFTSEDDAGTTTDVASIDGVLSVTTAAGESSYISFKTRMGGSALTECFRLAPDGVEGVKKLSTAAAGGEFAGKATVTGPATTAFVALASIAAADVVVVTPMAAPAAGDAFGVTIQAGVGFMIHMNQAPAAPCEFSYLIVRRT